MNIEEVSGVDLMSGYGYRLEVFDVYREILYIGSSPAVELLDLFL